MAATLSGVRDRAAWPLLLALALVVVAPSACIIWFMTEAARNEAAAARLRLSEARRWQLRLLRDRIDASWQSRLAALGHLPDGGARTFHHAIVAGMADALIVGGEDGSPMYPSLGPSPASPDDLTSDPDWRAAATLESSGDQREAARMYAALAGRTGDGAHAARAAQARVRALVQAGDTDDALRAIERYVSSGPMVDQRLSRERGGCGLGLSIVEFIVRAHGGDVTVRSEPGGGSAFTVTLPSRAAAREAVA